MVNSAFSDGLCRFPGLELFSCKLLANSAAVADVLVLNVYKTPSRKEGMGEKGKL
jgi:hypothetical protein